MLFRSVDLLKCKCMAYIYTGIHFSLSNYIRVTFRFIDVRFILNLPLSCCRRVSDVWTAPSEDSTPRLGGHLWYHVKNKTKPLPFRPLVRSRSYVAPVDEVKVVYSAICLGQLHSWRQSVKLRFLVQNLLGK